MRKPPGPMAHFHSLWTWAYGRSTEREKMHRETHMIVPSGDPQVTLDWLEWRGYRAALATPPGMVGRPGVLFGRKNEPLFLAQIGDVLVWDGVCIKIEE